MACGFLTVTVPKNQKQSIRCPVCRSGKDRVALKQHGHGGHGEVFGERIFEDAQSPPSLFIPGHPPVKPDTPLGSHTPARSRKPLRSHKVASSTLWL